MAESAGNAAAQSPKGGRLPLIVGLCAAVLCGAGGFYATFNGLVLPNHDAAGDGHVVSDEAQKAPATANQDVAFVAVDPIIISLGPASNARHLRFAAQLEVPSASVSEVARVMPRVLDVLNGYLRAVETSLLEDPSSMARLKAQMLRRVQIVVGDGQVQDLLISEFVLN